MIPAVIAQGLREAAPEVGGLLLVVALVAALAWLGRRQEARRDRAYRAQLVARFRASQDDRPMLLPPDGPVWEDLPAPVDPWPDADQHDLVVLTALDISPAGAR